MVTTAANAGVLSTARAVSSRADCPAALGLALVLLPWAAVILLTAGVFATLNFLAYAIIALAAGYGIASIVLPSSLRSQVVALSPSLGVLTISALTTFWLRLGLPLVWSSILWFALTSAGALSLWRDRPLLQKATFPYGRSLAVLSLLVCVIFFLPGARNDAVRRSDGSFNWIYVDTQYNTAIAAGIKSGESPPKEPGTATFQLLYHFGPYAPASAIARFDGLDVGTAYARVTRGVSLCALILSCFCLGSLLSFRLNGTQFGGVASVAGLFFYGSLLSLFANETNSSSHVAGAILHTVPGVEVPGNGGPFSHLILGHSVLHGMVVITTVMALCLIYRDSAAVPARRAFPLLAMPALGVAVHSVAALYCLGVVSILLFWGRLRQWRSWISIATLLALFLAAWKIMGFAHAPDAALATINKNLFGNWHWIAVWLVIGLGFRVVAFRWISKPLADPLSLLVLATFVGLLSFSLFLQFEHGQERYGMYFLQALFSIFAFARVPAGWWKWSQSLRCTEDWMSAMKNVLIILAASAILLRIVARLVHSDVWVGSFRRDILPCIGMALLLAGAPLLMKKNPRFAQAGSAVVAAVLLIGFLAWIAPWINFGLGRMKMDVALTPGEVRGLDRLRQLAMPNEHFATNKHSLDFVAAMPERSYGYSAVSERPVLLEGYAYQGVTSLPYFQKLSRENDAMFTSADADTVHNLARNWQVRWLVARPGTDISLARPLPSWLLQEPDTGTLKIYRVD